jgi:hypothetical protein
MAGIGATIKSLAAQLRTARPAGGWSAEVVGGMRRRVMDAAGLGPPQLAALSTILSFIFGTAGAVAPGAAAAAAGAVAGPEAQQGQGQGQGSLAQAQAAGQPQLQVQVEELRAAATELARVRAAACSCAPPSVLASRSECCLHGSELGSSQGWAALLHLPAGVASPGSSPGAASPWAPSPRHSTCSAATAQGCSIGALADLERRLLRLYQVQAWQQLGCEQAPSLLQLLAGSAELVEALAGGPQGGARAGLQEVLQLAAQAAAAVGLQLHPDGQQGAVPAAATAAAGEEEGGAAAVEADEGQLRAVSAALCSHFGVQRVEVLGHGNTAALLAACREQRTQTSHSVKAAAALAAGAATQPAAVAAEGPEEWAPQGPAAAALAALRAAPELCDLGLWCQWEQRFQPALGPLGDWLAREGAWVVAGWRGLAGARGLLQLLAPSLLLACGTDLLLPAQCSGNVVL